MEYYDLLKVIAVTRSCKLRIKTLFSDYDLFNESDLSILCNYYVSLQSLEAVFEDYFYKNQNNLDKKIENKDFLETILSYIQICAYLEKEVNNFISTEVN